MDDKTPMRGRHMQSVREKLQCMLREDLRMDREQLVLNIFIVTATLTTIVFIILKNIAFSDPYSYGRSLSYRPLLFSACLIPSVLLIFFYTERFIDRKPALSLGIWYVIGGVSQVAMRYLYVRPFEEVLELNRFADFVKGYSLTDLIRNYNSLSSGYFSPNIRNNMPGKGIMMKLLEGLTGNLVVRGILLVLISNLGAFLIYFICLRLFENRRVAIYASVLYLFLPARIFFLTQPNIITPVFVLTCFFLLLLYLDKCKAVIACLFGVSIYLLVYFEPSPLVLGVVFLAFPIKYLNEDKIKIWDLLRGLLFALAAFMAVFLIFLMMWDYNIASSILLKFSTGMDGVSSDPYLTSLISSLREFFLGMSVAQSIVFLASCVFLAKEISSIRKRLTGNGRTLIAYIQQPFPLLLLSLSLSLITLNLIGVNRVEITRTWIYMMVFVEMCVAFYIDQNCKRITFYLVLACMILQAAFSISAIVYV
jgi:hypothetical protein